MNAPAEQLVSLVAPASMEADQYRGLRHTIERMRGNGVQMLAITSPGPGDGKSVTTLNLAGSLAQSKESRVLVVDADLHRPSVAKYLGIDEPDAPGLVDLILNEDASFGQIVRRLDALNLSVVLPGVCHSGAYELLNSPRLAARLKEARSSFDYVLIDTPPLLPLPDCRLIGQWVDGFIILVTAHRTPRKALAEALALLDSSKVLGTVFNGDDRPLAPYGGYYGYYGRHEVASPKGTRSSH
jgi:capsular exopolysaccharide synthesis family protein